jgi:hypothetical protein
MGGQIVRSEVTALGLDSRGYSLSNGPFVEGLPSLPSQRRKVAARSS